MRRDQIIGHTDLGHLSEGAVADIAVLSIQEGNFGLVDAAGHRLNTGRKIQGKLTIKDGEIRYDLNGISRGYWDPEYLDELPDWLEIEEEDS